MPDTREARSQRLADRVTNAVAATHLATETPPPRRRFRPPWSPLAQAATLLALLGSGWQASSYFGEIKRRQDATDASLTALYTGMAVLNGQMTDLRRAFHHAMVRPGNAAL